MVKPAQTLAIQLLRESWRHWTDWKEPISARLLQARYAVAFSKLKLDSFFANYVEALADAGLFHVERTRTGKRWVFIQDVWDEFSEAERAEWKSRCAQLRDVIR